MTLTEMIYEVWEILRRNIVDDDEIDERLIKKMIIDQRQLWLSNTLSKGELNENGAGGSASGALWGYERYIQTIEGAELESFLCDNSVAPCIDTMYLCRTIELVPDMLTLKGYPAVVRLLPYDCFFDIKIEFNSFDRARYGGNGKFNTNQVFSFYRDGLLYFACKDSTTIDALQYITIDGIFADPTEVPNWDDDTSRFPIDGKIWEYMLPAIIEKLSIKLKGFEDKTNDSEDQELDSDG